MAWLVVEAFTKRTTGLRKSFRGAAQILITSCRENTKSKKLKLGSVSIVHDGIGCITTLPDGEFF